MIHTVCLVGCSKTKLPYAAPAKELYTSPLFKLGRAWAEANSDAWAILSAHHGLIEPDSIIEPYDITIDQRIPFGHTRPLGVNEFATWFSCRVQSWFGQFCTPTYRPDMVVLAGQDYCSMLESGPQKFQLVKPLHKMEIGQRLQFLKASQAV